MATTLQDIASEVGVSVATVSRVLHRRDEKRISPITRRRVREAALRLGYHPNRYARALVTGRAHLVALWVPYLWYPFSSEVMDHIQCEVDSTDFDMIVKGTEGDRARQVETMSRLAQQVEGILVVDRPDLLHEVLQVTPQPLTAVVSMGCYVNEAVDCVKVDLGPGMADAARHLIGEGCSRITYLVSRSASNDQQGRLAAYRRVMEEAGLEPRIEMTDGTFREGAHQAILRMGKLGALPDAICCHNDATAVGALRALHELGIQVPEEVAIVGCDGVPETEYTHPQLSTIIMPVEEMCRQGWALLQNRLHDPGLPRQLVHLTANFVARASSMGHGGSQAARGRKHGGKG